MADKIKLVRGDTRPQIKMTLTNEITGAPIDITGADLLFRFRETGTTEVLDIINGVVTDGENGEVVFLWNEDSLNVDPGEYEGEVEITFPSGEIQTVYDLLKFKLREDFAS